MKTQLLSYCYLCCFRLLVLDVNAPRAELEEESDTELEMFSMDQTLICHPVANALDLAMDIMYRFIHTQCHYSNDICWQRTKSLYTDLIAVFDKVILPTHGSHHVQFLVFYLLSFKNNLLFYFLQYLWKKVTDPNVFYVIRQAALGYIASLLSRAKYVPIRWVIVTSVYITKFIIYTFVTSLTLHA